MAKANCSAATLFCSDVTEINKKSATADDHRSLDVLLKLAEKPHAGESRAFKIRRQWHIKRTELDHWVDAQTRGRDGGGRGE